MSPKLYNKYNIDGDIPYVYIGRGSPYDNPFKTGIDGNRDQVCDLYEQYVKDNEILRRFIKRNLRSKNLGCFCIPKRCHGDILLGLANE